VDACDGFAGSRQSGQAPLSAQLLHITHRRHMDNEESSVQHQAEKASRATVAVIV
jgi:hypothetical protein